MNMQIFGTKKCNDTKKAERFFKERGIKYQFIDMKEKGMSKGEFLSVAQSNGGIEEMVAWDGKEQDIVTLIKYLSEEEGLFTFEDVAGTVADKMIRRHPHVFSGVVFAT